ncbi:outer membrane transport energization protein TonB [Roseovarius lutimaris]|uniref:Outer membrane transport energization protein TonB n=1 Tax=Roseovarius lutimaris TaxID=1005928 RepID=A0A1I5H2C3_9RHOB|nr:TonB family protein [Roseovarius lutimaris]SFO42369.1 outer membrane transport energization protein TonB [Roseovarius lutimaris]
MIRSGEFIVFIGIAALVHVGLFVQFGQTGVQSHGAAGQASVSLMASSTDIADRVAAWTRPVEAMQQMPEPLTPPDTPSPQTLTAPALSPPKAERDMVAMPGQSHRVPALPGPTESLPQINTDTTKPDILNHAPKTSLRPKTRPEPSVTPTKPKTQTVAAASKKQTASDGETGQNAGNTQATQSASLSEASRKSLISQWGASIRNRIERRKRYPSGTSDSGTTVLRIAVSRPGRLNGVTIVRSSGSKTLDQAAIRAVKKARYPAAPTGLTAAQYNFNLPVSFTRN